MYDAATPTGVPYFLDKTPRYHFVTAELASTFPDAEYVFFGAIRSQLSRSDHRDVRPGPAGTSSRTRPISTRASIVSWCCSTSSAIAPSACATRTWSSIRRRRHSNSTSTWRSAPHDDIIDRFADVSLAGTMGDQVGYARVRDAHERTAREVAHGVGEPAAAPLGAPLSRLARRVATRRDGIRPRDVEALSPTARARLPTRRLRRGASAGRNRVVHDRARERPREARRSSRSHERLVIHT